MKVAEISTGRTYVGRSSRRPGEQRRVLGIKDGEVHFVVTANPNRSWGFQWGVGSTFRVYLKTFARWAQAEVLQDPSKCPRCQTPLQPGIATLQTYTGVPDFPGDHHLTTVSPGGPGKVGDCLKCPSCGYSRHPRPDECHETPQVR